MKPTHGAAAAAPVSQDPIVLPAGGAAPDPGRREFIARGLAGAAALALAPAAAVASPGTPPANPVYRIHPAIGIARLGNADPGTFFVGPEIPGQGATGAAPGSAVPPYKSDGKVKPQAARFRVFEYAWVGGVLTPVREVTLDTPGVASISWTVHLANKKASFRAFEGPLGERYAPGPYRNASVTDRRSLEIDFGPRTIAGASRPAVAFTPGTSANPSLESCPRTVRGAAVIDYLGQLRTDAAGRLLVLGGKGKAGYQSATPPPLTTYANNDGWFDDASDGPVTAVVTLTDGRQVPVDAAGGAWVLCAPPDFAPPVRAIVTMYDLLSDVAVRSMPIPSNHAFYAPGGPLEALKALQRDYHPGAEYEFPTFLPEFARDIQPVLRAAYDMWWVTALVNQKHDSLLDAVLADPGEAARKDRQGVFTYLRAPLGVANATGPRTMPRLLGDSPYDGHEPDAIRKLTITHVQFGMFRRWVDGSFLNSPPPPAATSVTPHGLDRAALEACVGGAFFPGIEASWQLRNPALFAEPFRLNLAATSGYLGEEGVPIAPGHFSRQMAVPWQADFNDCRNEGDYGWWPSQRPDDVLPAPNATARVDWARPDTKYTGGAQKSSHDDMVANWWKFGFVVAQGNMLVESERTPSVP